MQINVISGKVGFKGESKFTATGTQVIQFSVSDRRKSKDKVEYFNITLSAFGKTAEFVEKYIERGDQVVVNYTLNTEIYVQEKDGQHIGRYQGMVNEINRFWPDKEDKPEEEVKDQIPF